MNYEAIEVRKLTPTIGAEIVGVDIANGVSNSQFDEIHRALLENLVIFFRDQDITLDQHKEFGRRFGKLHVHPQPSIPVEGHPDIIAIKADETSKRVSGAEWHSDVTCDVEPPMGSILHLQEVPENGGGDTLFANMYAAYEALSASMKDFLDGLSAIHSGEHFRPRTNDRTKTFPINEHPVVRTHPETRRKALFVNRIFTTKIAQLSEEESDSVLDLLYRHTEKPQWQCRFKWRPNSIAFWDNRCVLHHAMWDYFPQRRFGYRVTVCGDKPV